MEKGVIRNALFHGKEWILDVFIKRIKDKDERVFRLSSPSGSTFLKEIPEEEIPTWVDHEHIPTDVDVVESKPIDIPDEDLVYVAINRKSTIERLDKEGFEVGVAIVLYDAFRYPCHFRVMKRKR